MARMKAKPPCLAELSKFYDERYASSYMETLPRSWVRQVEDTLAEVSAPVDRLVDYGCGQGTWIPVLTERFPGVTICGIDISEQAIIKAKEKFPDYDLRVFDGSLAPFEPESFDMVFCFHALEHVTDLKRTVADLSRLVRKDGRIVAILPCGNDGSFEERLVRQIKDGREVSTDGGIRFFYEDPGHLRRLRTDELVRLLQSMTSRYAEPSTPISCGARSRGWREWALALCVSFATTEEAAQWGRRGLSSSFSDVSLFLWRSRCEFRG
jgi:SAM-dependent methyltransferase